ncbi:MAG TPA: NlpC/P60 family protein [Acidimicrobiales bacterium]|nr:NlpC/P60 family protein [Acidimicrobiales bacterium]
MATSTSPSGVLSHPVRLAVSVIAGLVLTLPALLPSSAGADAIGDARAQAAAIEAKLNVLNAQLEKLDEQYNAATIRLSQVNDDITAGEKQLDETKKKLAEDAAQLRAYAISAYMTGDDTPALEAVLTSQGSAATERKGYLEAAAGNRQDLIDKLAATQHDVDTQLAQLHRQHDEAAKLAAQLSSATAQERAAVSQQVQLHAQATGKVAELLHQQEAAQAAADRAAAAQAAAAAHAAARLTAAAPTTSSSGSGSDVTPPPVFVPPPGSGATVAVAAAESQIGVPYIWAGATPGVGFDCSGLTMWAWAQGGVSLPHSAQGQYDMSTHISESDLQPGDLVFFGSSAGSIEHVGMYVGGGTMVHAPHTGAFVTYQSISYWPGEGMWFGRV